MTDKLGHRERLLRAIDGQEIDRPPCFFRAEPELCDKIKKQLNLQDDQEISDHFDSDARHIWPPLKEGFKLPDLKNIETVADIDNACWPQPADMVDIEKGQTLSQQAWESGLAVYGGVWASIFTHSRDMVGEEKYLINLAADPGLIAHLVEKLTDFFLAANQVYLSACARWHDIYYFGSDFGTQRSLFISPDMIRRFYKPHMQRIVEQAKSFDLKVMFHTCGAVSEIIDDLIDIGIDIIDPVQVSAAHMQPESLAAQFKGRIAFHGGINNQTTLTFGRPDDVRQEVNRTIKALGPLAYVVSPDQDMIGDVPLENIEALFQAVREYPL